MQIKGSDDDKREIVGRKGIVMNITHRVELERILETRKEIQRFIHGFIAPTMSIHAASQVAAGEIERVVGINTLSRIWVAGNI